MTSAALAVWAAAVGARDVICQDCGASDHLHAHHIRAKAEYPDLALDVNNGVLLCRKCHALRHGDKPGLATIIEFPHRRRMGKRRAAEVLEFREPPSLSLSAFNAALSELGWTRTELCHQLGLHRNTPSRWRGEVPGYVAEYLRLALAVKRFPMVGDIL